MRLSFALALMPAIVLSQTPEKLFQERKYTEARTAAHALLASNKTDANAMYWVGRAYEAENKNSEAMDWFEKAIKIDDKNALYHLWLGNAVGTEAQNANKLRQPFLAKRVKNEFERAVALDPTLIDAREGLISFYQQAPGFMGGSNAKARDQVAEIRKLNPYRGHFAAARYAQRDKDLPGAEKEWQAALAAFPDSASLFFQLAANQRQQTKWADAFATYDRLMKAKPDELVAHLGWGAVSSLSGLQYERGEKELRTFIASATPEKHGTVNVAGAHYRLGQILEKTNRRDQAKPEYQEALRINPQNADAKKALAALK